MKDRANSWSNFVCDKQHPFSSSSVGICPHCLKERLWELVCSECGERRASSCCCSQFQTLFHRNSCSNADVGRGSRSLRRSSSSSIKGLFGKKTREKIEFCDEMELDRFCMYPIPGPGFIEVKLGASSGWRRRSIASDFGNQDLEILENLRTNGVSGKGSSCRISMKERLLKTRTTKLWKWIFKNRDQK